MAAAALLLWLAVCAAWDWRTRTVPNMLTLPALAAALAFRVALWRWSMMGVVLAAGYLWLWQRGALGGADAKIGLTLTLLSPWWGYLALAGAVALGAAWKLTGRERHTPAVVGMFLAVLLLTTLGGLHIIKASAQGVVRLFSGRPLEGGLFVLTHSTLEVPYVRGFPFPSGRQSPLRGRRPLHCPRGDYRDWRARRIGAENRRGLPKRPQRFAVR